MYILATALKVTNVRIGRNHFLNAALFFKDAAVVKKNSVINNLLHVQYYITVK